MNGTETRDILRTTYFNNKKKSPHQTYFIFWIKPIGNIYRKHTTYTIQHTLNAVKELRYKTAQHNTQNTMYTKCVCKTHFAPLNWLSQSPNGMQQEITAFSERCATLAKNPNRVIIIFPNFPEHPTKMTTTGGENSSLSNEKQRGSSTVCGTRRNCILRG